GVLRNPNEVLSQIARVRLSHVLESDSTITIVGEDETGPGRATAPGARLVWHFVADTVNDFAWATAKNFVWEATRATIPGRGPMPVNIYRQPGHAAQYAQAGPILRHALEFYSKMLMPDPFPQHTMVDGPDNGMEYPMLVMSNDGPADHETEHQWAPMAVSTNETWYGWMDEGFNQYMNILSDADTKHEPPNLNGRGQSYGRTSGDEHEGPLMWDANYGGPSYSFQAYGKTPLMLSMLGGIVGDSAVWRAQSEYTRAWRFKHPSPWDYMFFMSRALQRDLGWFWYAWAFTTESVDGSIQSVTPNGSHTTVVVREDGQMPSPVILKVELGPGSGTVSMPNAKMIDGRTAMITYPVDVWFGGSRTFSADLDVGGRTVTKVTFDPGCRFPDHDPSDNVWPREPSTPASGARGGRGAGAGGGRGALNPACSG
ncbi:MAG TPA: M1 family peptidase, partial [Gemmatimonadaceae bacterium]|nr:M1 family peptidase [Gemmatimonadaceae bacterium]